MVSKARLLNIICPQTVLTMPLWGPGVRSPNSVGREFRSAAWVSQPEVTRRSDSDRKQEKPRTNGIMKFLRKASRMLVSFPPVVLDCEISGLLGRCSLGAGWVWPKQ